MNITVAFTSGTGTASRTMPAYDTACVVTVSGLTLSGSNYLYLTTREGAMALATRALITANVATLNLNNSTIQSFIPANARQNYPARLTVRNISSGAVVGTALVEIEPTANPNADTTRVGIDYATTADIADLQSQIDAIEAGALDISVTDDSLTGIGTVSSPLAIARTTDNPANLGTASPGTADTSSRSDHVHQMPSASNVGAYRSQTPAAAAEVSGANVAPDFDTNLTLQWTLTGNVTSFAAAANLADGESGMVLATLGAYGIPAAPPSGAYKGAWTVTGPLVRILIERVGSVYLWSADSLEVVS